MVGPVSFQGLQNVQNSQTRYVDAGNGNFRAANEGSWKDKAINWLKETFRPGLVKQENAQAYAAAKQAFIAGGGEGTRAAEFFNGKIASGAKFTPADIKPIWNQIAFNAEEARDIENGLRTNADIGSPGSTLTITGVSVAGTDRTVTEQFIKDASRSHIVIDGDTVDKTDAMSSSFAIAQRHGISDHDMEGLSKFVNQSAAAGYTKVLSGIVQPGEDPAKATYVRPDGSRLEIMPNLSSMTYDVQSQGGGCYKIDITARGGFIACQHIAASGQFIGDTGFDPGTSRCAVSISMTVGPDPASGEMSLVSLDSAKRSVNVFSPSGDRII